MEKTTSDTRVNSLHLDLEISEAHHGGFLYPEKFHHRKSIRIDESTPSKRSLPWPSLNNYNGFTIKPNKLRAFESSNQPGRKSNQNTRTSFSSLFESHEFYTSNNFRESKRNSNIISDSVLKNEVLPVTILNSYLKPVTNEGSYIPSIRLSTEELRHSLSIQSPQKGAHKRASVVSISQLEDQYLLKNLVTEIPSLDSPSEAQPFSRYDQTNVLNRCIKKNFFIQHCWIHLISESLLEGNIEAAYTMLDIISEQEDYRLQPHFDSFTSDKKSIDTRTSSIPYGLFDFFSSYLSHFFPSKALELLNPIDFFMLITASITICHVVQFLKPTDRLPLHTLCAICHIYKTYCLNTIIRFFDINFVNQLLNGGNYNLLNSMDNICENSPLNRSPQFTENLFTEPNASHIPTSLCDLPFFHLNVVSAYLVDPMILLETQAEQDGITFHPSNCSLSEFLNTALSNYLSIASILYSLGIQIFESESFETTPWNGSNFTFRPNKIYRELNGPQFMINHSINTFLNDDQATSIQNNLRNRDKMKTYDNYPPTFKLFDLLLGSFFNSKSFDKHTENFSQMNSPNYSQHQFYRKEKHLSLFLDFIQCFLLNNQKQFLDFSIKFKEENSNLAPHIVQNNFFIKDPFELTNIYDVYSDLWESIILHLKSFSEKLLPEQDIDCLYNEPQLKIIQALNKDTFVFGEKQDTVHLIIKKALRFSLLQVCSMKVMKLYSRIFLSNSKLEVTSEQFDQLYFESKETLSEYTSKLHLQNYSDMKEVLDLSADNIEEHLQIYWLSLIQEFCQLVILIRYYPSFMKHGSKRSDSLNPNTLNAIKVSDISEEHNPSGTKQDLKPKTSFFLNESTSKEWERKIDYYKEILENQLNKVMKLFEHNNFSICTQEQRDWMWLDKDELWIQSIQFISSSMLISGKYISQMEEFLKSHYQMIIEIAQNRSNELNIVVAGWQVASHRICLLLHQFDLNYVLSELCRWNYLFESFTHNNKEEILLSTVELNFLFIRLLLLTNNYTQAEILSESIKYRVKQSSGFPHYRSFCLMLMIDCLLYSSWLDHFLTQYKRWKAYGDDPKQEIILKQKALPLATRHAFEALYHLMSHFHRATAVVLKDFYICNKIFQTQREIVELQKLAPDDQFQTLFLNDTFIMQAVAVALQAQLTLSEAIPICSDSMGISNTLMNNIAPWLFTNAKEQLKWITKIIHKLGHHELLSICFLIETNVDNYGKLNKNKSRAHKLNLVFKLGSMSPLFKHRAARCLMTNFQLTESDLLDCMNEVSQLAQLMFDQRSQVKSPQSEMWQLLKNIHQSSSTPESELSAFLSPEKA